MAKQILVVDDQPGIRLLLTDILIDEGYSVTAAENGQEAIDKLKENTYNLLLIDYKLPIIDGIGVLQNMFASGINTPTILMSGIVEKLETESNKYPQVKKLLGKPFNVIEVKELVSYYA